MTDAEPLIAGFLATTSTTLGLAALAHRSNPGLLAPLGGVSVRGHGAFHRLLTRVGVSPVGRLVPRESLARATAAAATAWHPDEIAGAKALMPVAVLAMLIGPSSLRPVALVLAPVAYRAPEMLLARAARRRLAAARRELPVFLDLLAVATSAGLSPQLAVRQAAAAVLGPLGDELSASIRAVDLGGRWRHELAAVADRLALPELRRTVSTLARTESLGSALAAEVVRLAADVRRSRRAIATERARTAPVKMLFPLVFLILPAFLLLTVVPVLLTTVRSIG